MAEAALANSLFTGFSISFSVGRSRGLNLTPARAAFDAEEANQKEASSGRYSIMFGICSAFYGETGALNMKRFGAGRQPAKSNKVCAFWLLLTLTRQAKPEACMRAHTHGSKHEVGVQYRAHVDMAETKRQRHFEKSPPPRPPPTVVC